MSKVTFLTALFALLNFMLTFANEAHSHPGCQGASRVVLDEEGGECDGEECDDDKDGEGDEET